MAGGYPAFCMGGASQGNLVRSGRVYYPARIWGLESHKAAWATSEVSTGLNLATLEWIDVTHQGSPGYLRTADE